MKKFWLLICLLLITSLCLGQTKFDVTTQVKGTLAVTNGGTNNASVGNNGQVLISNGVDSFVPGDPLVTVADLIQSVSISSTTCTGTPPTGTGCQSIAMQGKQSTSVVFPSATWTGTIVFEQSIDGQNYIGSDVWNETTESWQQAFTCASTCNGMFWFEPLGAIVSVRVRATAWTSGTATGTLAATNQPMGTFEYQAGPGGTAPPNAVYTGGNDGSGNFTGIYIDPCKRGPKTSTPISLTASGRIIVGTLTKKFYICSLDVVVAGANNVALVEGTGTTCATGIAGVAGGTTAGTGWNFAANGGLTKGNGDAVVFAAATAADDACLLISAATQVSGSVQWVEF